MGCQLQLLRLHNSLYDMDLLESPEIEFELRQLKKWTCMLDDLQLTTAIVQMVQETSFAQVRFLMDVLKQREIEYTILQGPSSGMSASAIFV